jgi:hypothetical protein
MQVRKIGKFAWRNKKFKNTLPFERLEFVTYKSFVCRHLVSADVITVFLVHMKWRLAFVSY